MSPKLRSLSTLTRLILTVAHEGGSSVFSNRLSCCLGLPVSMRQIYSHPIRFSLSSLGSLPMLATTRCRGPLAVRTDSTSDQYPYSSPSTFLSYRRRYMTDIISYLCVICKGQFCTTFAFQNTLIFSLKLNSEKKQIFLE